MTSHDIDVMAQEEHSGGRCLPMKDGLYLLHNQTSAAHMLERKNAHVVGFWLEVRRLVIEPDAPEWRSEQALRGGRHRRCQPGLEEDRQILIAPDGHRCGCCDDRNCGSQGSAGPTHGTGQQAAPAARMHHRAADRAV